MVAVEEYSVAATGNHTTSSNASSSNKAGSTTTDTQQSDSGQSGESNSYLTLFHRYISRSIEAVVARLEPGPSELAPDAPEKVGGKVADDLREQAWHLLEYGLKLDKSFEEEGWAGVRALLFALAPRMERDGFRHEWVPYLEGGVAYSQRVGDVESQAQLSLYIGRLYRLRSEFKPARDWFLASAQLYQHVGDEKSQRAGRAKALNQLAYVARMQHQYDLTQQYVDEALALLDGLAALGEDDSERANCYWVLGAMAHAQADWEGAERHNRASFEIWQRAGNLQRAAWSLQNLGDSLRGAGKYEEAAAHLQEAIVLLGQLHDPVNQAIARMNRGIVHIYASYDSASITSASINSASAPIAEAGAESEGKKESAQALALFQLAEAIFRQVGDQLHLVMVYTNMTIVQRDLGQYSAAEESGKRALRLADVLSDLKYLANGHDELGQVYLAQGRNEEAIATLEEGLAVIAQVPPDGFQKMVQASLQEHLAQARGVDMV